MKFKLTGEIEIEGTPDQVESVKRDLIEDLWYTVEDHDAKGGETIRMEED